MRFIVLHILLSITRASLEKRDSIQKKQKMYWIDFHLKNSVNIFCTNNIQIFTLTTKYSWAAIFTPIWFKMTETAYYCMKIRTLCWTQTFLQIFQNQKQHFLPFCTKFKKFSIVVEFMNAITTQYCFISYIRVPHLKF